MSAWKRTRAAAFWVAHAAPWILGVTAVNALTGPWVSLYRFDVVWCCGTLAFFAGLIHRDDEKCRRCKPITMLLNPRATVARYSSALWAFHHDLMVIGFGLLALLSVGFLIPGDFGLGVCRAVFATIYMATFLCNYRHRVLRKFCPLCRERPGDGGGASWLPEPLPVDAGHK